MKYTWLDKEATVVVNEIYSGVYDVSVSVDDQSIHIAGMEQENDGGYVAVADGYFYRGDTMEKAYMPAVVMKQEQIKSLIESKSRVQKEAAARQKRREEEKKRQEAFE